MARRGFSMIELVIVLAIIATLAAIAMPRYTASLSNYRADAAARRIVADFTYARTRAIAGSTGQAVVFTPSNHSYQLTGATSADKPSSAFVVSLAADPYKAVIDHIDFGGTGATTFTFNGYGYPDKGGFVVVRVGSATRRVVLSRAQGTTEVQ